MKVRCLYNVPWFWGKFFRGFTIYPYIFFKDKKEDVDEVLFRHEWEHVKFYWSYLVENITVGYKLNKYEVAAYKVQSSPLTKDQKRVYLLGRE
jgi:hypothetical protein